MSLPVSENARQETVLDDALAAVLGQNLRDYDHPAVNFGRTALLWTILISHLHPNRNGVIVLTPHHVAMMIIAFKLAREMGTSKRDNWVDMAGYVLCHDLIDRMLNSKDTTFFNDGTDSMDDLMAFIKSAKW